MDGNLSKALWIGVSVLLFIAVVTIGMSVFAGAKEVSIVANDKIGSITQNMADSEFKMFDGKEIKGDDVITAVDQYSGRSGEIIILVATLGSNGGNPVNLNPDTNTGLSISSYRQYVSHTNGSLSVDNRCIILSQGSGNLLTSVSKTVQNAARRDADNPNLTTIYINPSGKFISHLIYDTNEVIRGIIFAQME